MNRTSSHDFRGAGIRWAAQASGCLLLAVSPAAANGTLILPKCPERSTIEHHISRRLELVSVTRDGELLTQEQLPDTRWELKLGELSALLIDAPFTDGTPTLIVEEDPSGPGNEAFILFEQTEPTP